MRKRRVRLAVWLATLGLLIVLPVLLWSLFHTDDFDRDSLSRDDALDVVNKLLGKQALATFFSPDGQLHVRNTGTGQSVVANFQLSQLEDQPDSG